MHKDSSSKSTLIIMIVVVVVALGLYFYYKGSSPTDASLLSGASTPEAAQAQEAGGRVLSLLNEINSLKIDESIFNTATYRSLIDYSITVPPQNVGRPNPFAPVPGLNLNKTTATGR